MPGVGRNGGTRNSQRRLCRLPLAGARPSQHPSERIDRRREARIREHFHQPPQLGPGRGLFPAFPAGFPARSGNCVPPPPVFLRHVCPMRGMLSGEVMADDGAESPQILLRIVPRGTFFGKAARAVPASIRGSDFGTEGGGAGQLLTEKRSQNGRFSGNWTVFRPSSARGAPDVRVVFRRTAAAERAGPLDRGRHGAQGDEPSSAR